MAKQLKKIQKNIRAPKDDDFQDEEDTPVQVQRKPWENVLLVGVICLTLFLLTSGWEQLNALNRGMYGSLLASLLLMYAQRRLTLTPQKLLWLNRGIFTSIGISLLLFAISCYYEYFA